MLASANARHHQRSALVSLLLQRCRWCSLRLMQAISSRLLMARPATS